MQITGKLTVNHFPELLDRLRTHVPEATHETAQDVQALWSNDVRVSRGAGNYDGRNGGEPGHYRDNIVIEKLGPDVGGGNLNPRGGGFLIRALPHYAIFNEYGSITISAKPSARDAAEQGIEEAEARLGHLADQLTHGWH
jgi:hypothetical protein